MGGLGISGSAIKANPWVSFNPPKTIEPGTCDSFEEKSPEPIYGFMYVGSSYGGDFGFAITDPSTGESMGAKAALFSSGAKSAMVTIGGLGLGAVYNNGGLLPAVGYKGVYFYGNGASVGIFNFSSSGVSIAPFYFPLIVGAIGTISHVITNASDIEDLDNPGSHIFGTFFLKTIHSILPIGLFEEIFEGKIDPAMLQPADTRMGQIAAMRMLMELSGKEKYGRAAELARALFKISKKASPVVRAEFLNQEDIMLRLKNRTALPLTSLKRNIERALYAIEVFHEKYGEWLANGGGEAPSEAEVKEYMTAALFAAQKLAMVTEKLPRSGCLGIKASAPVSFDKIELRYLKAVSALSHILANRKSGIWGFFNDRLEETAKRLLSAAASSSAPTDKIVDLKFEIDSYLVWLSNITGLLGDGEERFSHLKWRIKKNSPGLLEEALKYKLAEKKELIKAQKSMKIGESFATYRGVRELFAMLDEAYVALQQESTESRSTAYAVAIRFEGVGLSYRTSIYNKIRKRLYDILHGSERVIISGHTNRLAKFHERLVIAFLDMIDEIEDIKDKKNPAYGQIMEQLGLLRKAFEKMSRHLNTPNLKCGLLDDIAKITKHEYQTVFNTTQAIRDFLEHMDIKEGDKKDVLEEIDNFLKRYGLYKEKRDAILAAGTISNNGGRICQM